MIKIVFFLVSIAYGFSSFAGVGGRATDDPEVVKRKLYTKKKTIEINGPNVGVILNQSYIDTFLIHAGINYFFSEIWGLGIEVTQAINSDKFARTCIESFINDPDDQIEAECGDGQIPANSDARATYGPAYVPIREIKTMLVANAVWNPVYGKQLMLLSATNYFDLFVSLGGGIAISDFYPKKTVLDNGKPSRGAVAQEATREEMPGAQPAESDLYGFNGRPTPEEQMHILFNFGIGQKYHFWKRFNLKAELRNYTLLGTDAGFDNFFTLWGGFGFRF